MHRNAKNGTLAFTTLARTMQHSRDYLREERSIFDAKGRAQRAQPPPQRGTSVSERRECQCTCAEQVSALSEQLQREQDENVALRRRMIEIAEFLRDYNLTWRGGEAPGGKLPPVDFPLLLFRLRHLSAGFSGHHIAVVGNAHIFQSAERLHIRIMKDGYLIKEGPFVSFDSDRGRAFLDDVLEGYYPSELKSAFPAGVAFDVTDDSHAVDEAPPASTVRKPFASFGGLGYRLS